MCVVQSAYSTRSTAISLSGNRHTQPGPSVNARGAVDSQAVTNVTKNAKTSSLMASVSAIPRWTATSAALFPWHPMAERTVPITQKQFALLGQLAQQIQALTKQQENVVATLMLGADIDNAAYRGTRAVDGTFLLVLDIETKAEPMAG